MSFGKKFGEILNKIFGYGGFRWSLLVKNGNEAVYAMHSNSVIFIIGYIERRFKNNSRPVSPWSLHLNFNKDDRSFPLKAEYFSWDESDYYSQLSPELLSKLSSIDPNFKNFTQDIAVFEDLRTNETINLGQQHHVKPSLENIEEYMAKNKRDRNALSETRVFNQVFGA